jgi:anti-sigma factor RsiW
VENARASREQLMLTCKQLVELVTDYLEGALSAADRQRFETHLDDCAACSRYLDQMRTTIRMLGRLTEDSLPTGARERLLDVFREWKNEQPAGTAR